MKKSCFKTLVKLILLLFFMSSNIKVKSQVPQGWNVNANQTLTYNITVYMAYNGVTFTEQDNRTITIQINTGNVSITRVSSFEGSTQSFGPYSFTEDG